MTPAGWVMMVLSCGFVLALLVFCFYRVFTTPGTQEHMHAPLDIDTQDLDR
jgi:hypothetical protein